jgi:tetratricopeptide (TPR) repeat protein
MSETVIAAGFRKRLFSVEGKALAMLLAGLLIPALAALSWHFREPLAADYHFLVISHALDNNNSVQAEIHVARLFTLSRERVRETLSRVTAWPQKKRTQLAEIVLHCEPEDSPWRSRSTAAERFRIEMCLKLDPRHRETRKTAAETAFYSGDYQEAADQMDSLLKDPEFDGGYEEYMLLGQALSEMDKFPDAEACFRLAAAMVHWSDPLYSLEYVLQRQKKYADAIRVCTRRLGLDQIAQRPERPTILATRARMFALLGRDELSLMDLAAAEKMQQLVNDNDLSAILQIKQLRALALADMGRVDEATGIFESLREMRPEDYSLALRFSNMLETVGRSTEAIRIYQQALLQSPDNPGVYNNLSWLLLTASDKSRRDPVEALRLAEKAVELDGRREPTYLDTLAEAYYFTGDFARAVSCEEEAECKGGTTYRKSLARFRQALQDSRSGKAVALADSPLIGHNDYKKGEGGKDFNPDTVPAPPRIDAEYYFNTATGALARRKRLTFDDVTSLLANQWQAFPSSAIDDPLSDLYAIVGVLQRLTWNRAIDADNRDKFFCNGFLRVTHSYPQRGEIKNTGNKPATNGVSRKIDDSERRSVTTHVEEHTASINLPAENDLSQPSLILGEFTAKLLAGMTRQQTGRVMAALAGKNAHDVKLHLSECYASEYYVEVEGDGKTLFLEYTKERFARHWEMIRKRLEAIANGEQVEPRERKKTKIFPLQPERKIPVAPPLGD